MTTKQEQSNKLNNAEKNKGSNKETNFKLNICLCLLLSFAFGYLHVIHIERLFENDKHFSHLSNLERELSFRTESGLYYYYFKILVVEKNQNESIFKLINNLILNDNRTEYPSTINSLKRFNLYPELALAGLYRAMNSLNLLSKSCWRIDRGDLPPVESCEGNLEPIYFYVKCIFLLNGLLMSFLFTLCWLLNERSLLSGVIGCVCYFYNHSEATRVMWAPALRENFSFPLFIYLFIEYI